MNRRAAHTRPAAASLACIALVLAAACSSPVGKSADEGALTVTGFDEADIEIWKQVAEEYESSHPGAHVSVTQIPEDAYVAKLDTSMAVHEPPDVAYVYGIAQIHNFLPLDEPVYTENDLDLAGYNEGVLQQGCGDADGLYCAGGYVGGEVLFYNKDMFQKAGIPFPSTTEPMTMDEYSALAHKLAEPNEDLSRTQFGGDAEVPYYWVDLDLFLNESGDKIEFTDPAYVDVVTLLSDMVKDGVAPAPSQTQALGAQNGAADLFAQNKIAMVINDNEQFETADGHGINYGVAPVPVPAGTEPWVSTWTSSYGIPKDAAHPDEAADLLALWLTYGQKLQADNGLLPLQYEAAEKYFADDGGPHTEFLDVTKLARGTVFTPNLFAWTGTLEDAWTAIIRGDKSVEEALADAQPKAQQGLDRTWEQYRNATKGDG
jgi:multiple sugar transport system substrate-binding protein